MVSTRTAFRRRFAYKISIAGRLLIALSLLAGFFIWLAVSDGVYNNTALAATSSTINFQARLLSNTGNIVPDGNYHIEFKIYDSLAGGASAQGVCSGNSSSDDCWWREERTTGNLVRVVDGYFTVNLGSVTAFGASIPWDQELWLTMNIGGTSGPSYDGEMSPRMKFTAVPYAITAGRLQATDSSITNILQFATPSGSNKTITLPNETGTVCTTATVCSGYGAGSGSGSYIQNSTTVQTNANFAIQSAASGSIGGLIRAATSQSVDLLQFQDSSNNSLGGFDSGGQLFLGRASALTGTIRLFNSGTANTATIQTAVQGTSSVLTIPNAGAASDTFCLQTLANCNGGSGDTLQGAYNFDTDTGDTIIALTSADDGIIIRNPSSSGSDSTYNLVVDQLSTGAKGGISIQSAGTGNLFLVTDTTATARDVLTIADGGATTFRNQTDSTAAFQVQNAAGSSLVQVDSTNSNITLLGNNSGELQAWQTNGSSGLAIRHAPSTVTANGHIYVIGGYDTAVRDTNYYAKINTDGSVGNWTLEGDVLPAVRYYGGAETWNGYLYYIGGSNASNSAQTTVYYSKINHDGSTGAWQTTVALPGARNQMSTAVANGYLYVIGGHNNTTSQTTVYYAKLNADGTVGSWSTANALPQARFRTSSAVANGYIYVVGGEDDSSNTRDTVIYAKVNSDGTTGTWQCQGTAGTCGTTPANSNTLLAVRKVGSAGVANGYLYFMGGIDGSSVTQSTVYFTALASDGSTGSWSTNTNALTEQRQAQGSIVSNGYIYVIGGHDGTNVEGTVYYASTSRIKIGGSVDLVGLGGENLAEGGTGGSLTAGNTKIIGSLDVQAQASFAQSVVIDKELRVGGSALFQNTTNSTTAFQINSSTSVSILNVDTTNSLVGTAPTTSSSTNSQDFNLRTGNATGATSNSGTLRIDVGTATTTRGSILIGTINNANAITVGSATQTTPITLGQATTATTQTINIQSANGTASTQTIEIGGGTSTTSGGKVVNIANGIPGASTTNTVAIGTAGTTTGTVGITIGSATATAHTLVLQGGNGTGASSAVRIVTAAAGDILIGGTAQTGSINIGTSTGVQALNFGTGGTGAKTVTLGSTASTSTTTIQSGSSGISLINNGTTISSAELNLLDGHDVALVDTNDAVATAIIGTGALNAGSITSGFGAIDIGADNITTTGTTSTGVLTATGNTTLGDAVTDNLTIASAIQGTNALIFDGSTDDTNEITLAITNPGGDFTITLPAETGTICTTGSVCSGYAAATGGSGYIQLQGSTPGTAQTGHFNITGTGIAGTLQATNFDTASGVTLTLGNTNATAVSICNSATCDALTIGTNTDADTITIGETNDTTSINGGSSSTITFGNFSVQADGDIVTSGFVNGAGLNSFGVAFFGAGANTINGSSGQTLTINSGTTGDIYLGDDAQNESIFIGTGAAAKTVTLGSSNTTSTTTIQAGTGGIILQAAGTGAIDTVQIGAGGAGSSTPDLLGLDVKSDTGDPAGGFNGAMYYNEFSDKFRCYENGAWANCIGSAGAGVTLQGAYDADVDGSDSIITLSTADDGIIIRNPDSSGSDSTYILTLEQLEDDTGTLGGLSIQSAGTGNLFLVTDTTATARDVFTIANGGAITARNQTDSTAAFQIQNSAGTSLFTANTTGSEIVINSGGSTDLTINETNINRNVDATASTITLTNTGATAGAGAVARIQAPTPATISSGTSIGLAWTSPTTAGNLLVAILGLNSWPSPADTPTITPPSGGWTLATSTCNAGSTRPCSYIYYIEGADAHSGTETFTLADDNDASLALLEYSNILTSGALDLVANNTGTSTSTNSGTTGTTTQADELLIATMNNRADAGSPQGAPNNSFTEISEAQSRVNTEGVNTGHYERIVSSTGAYTTTATIGSSNYWSGAIATFKKATTIGAGFTLVPKAGNSQIGSSEVLDVQNASGGSLLSVEADGDVGIGTNTPGARLQVTSSVAQSLFIVRDTSGTATDVLTVGDGGAFTVNPSDVTKTITLGSALQTGATTIGRSTAANTISIGSAATNNAQVVTIANGVITTGVSSVSILSGTAGSSGSATLSLGNSDRVTQIDIGNVVADAARTLNFGTGANTAAIDTLNIGTGNTTVAGGKTINIGSGTPSGSGTNLITIGATANASTTTLQGGTGASAVAIRAGSGGTIAIGSSGVANTVQIGNTTGAVAQTINIGNNATASSATTVVIGSTIGTSPVTIQAGSSGVLFQSADGTTAFRVQDASGDAIFVVDTTNDEIEIGKPSDTTAKLVLNNSTNANTVTISPGVTSSSYTLTLPTTSGASNECIKNTGTAGTLTFGSCDNASFSSTILTPEYPGATLTPDGTNNSGTMTTDFCSGTGRLSLNTGLCASASDEHNYYYWTTSQASDQDFDIYIRHQLLVATNDTASTFNIYGWRTDSSNNSANVTLFNSSGAQCGATTNVATGTATWTETAIGSVSGDTDCDMTAGTVMLIRIKLTASQNEYAASGEIRITY